MNVLINNQLLILCKMYRRVDTGQGNQPFAGFKSLYFIMLLLESLFLRSVVVRFFFDKRELVNKSVKCIGG